MLYCNSLESSRNFENCEICQYLKRGSSGQKFNLMHSPTNTQIQDFYEYFIANI